MSREQFLTVSPVMSRFQSLVGSANIKGLTDVELPEATDYHMASHLIWGVMGVNRLYAEMDIARNLDLSLELGQRAAEWALIDHYATWGHAFAEAEELAADIPQPRHPANQPRLRLVSDENQA